MKIRLLIFPLLLIVYFSFTRCENNNEEHLYGDNCDTLNMTYSKVAFIFQDNCIVCHNETTNYHDIKLYSYSNVKVAVSTNKLLPAINHTGIYQMPKGQPQLSDCQIDKIEAWINAGMPE
jgi:hypothetical protein